jgi:hypothetical protein
MEAFTAREPMIDLAMRQPPNNLHAQQFVVVRSLAFVDRRRERSRFAVGSIRIRRSVLSRRISPLEEGHCPTRLEHIMQKEEPSVCSRSVLAMSSIHFAIFRLWSPYMRIPGQTSELTSIYLIQTCCIPSDEPALD